MMGDRAEVPHNDHFDGYIRAVQALTYIRGYIEGMITTQHSDDELQQMRERVNQLWPDQWPID